jgi:Fe-S cluster assembly iron-binding protein IscA
MLQLTAEAALRIRHLRPTCLPDHQILRIANNGRRSAGTVRLSFVEVAREGDQFGKSQGIQMCVCPEFADRLSGMVLDVRDGDSDDLRIRAA